MLETQFKTAIKKIKQKKIMRAIWISVWCLKFFETSFNSQLKTGIEPLFHSFSQALKTLT